MPKDRGAEQGNVDGSLECSLALGMLAAETRMRTAAQQAAASHGLESLIFRTAATEGRPRNQSAEISQFPVRRPGKAHRCPRPAASVSEKRRPGVLMVHG